MAFQLPPLPYDKKALSPHISAETLDFHYGKHHKNYVDTLNKLVEGKPEAKKSLEELIVDSSGPIFNNAAQTWNHTFYWNCMSPDGGGKPTGALDKAIKLEFGSFEVFKNQFSETAAKLFGSGWTWLVKDSGGSLKIIPAPDADNPLKQKQHPLLALDVWEHAYYIDYRNERKKYIDIFWKLVNWEFVESQLQGVAHATSSR